jgi:oligosaccharide 4-alpha-D-glucosyltransferase
MTQNLIGAMALAVLVAPAAANTGRTLEGVAQKANQLEIRTSDGTYLVTPYSERIVETSFIPTGEQPDPRSHAVVLAPANVSATLREDADTIEYATAGIVVTIARSPFRLSYSYKGRPLVAEKNGYSRSERHEVLDFELEPAEALFGGGARALGMNRRGHRLALYNKAHYAYEKRSGLMSYTMPLVLSSKMYMLHFDNPSTGYLDLDKKKTNVLAYATTGGRKTYQVIAGDSWEQLAGEYTSLTGRQPLPPRWAFGNFASRFGYRSEAQARETVDKFIAAGIPLDAIVFDLYWFGKEMRFESMGNLAFEKESFPTPEKMIADFAAKGIKTILITEPFVLKASKRWPEAVEREVLATRADGTPLTFDSYFGETGLIDIVKPQARSWFWDIYKDLTNKGVAGWWGDLGEPEVHPADTRHATGTADEVHNIYGHEWARLVHEGYRKDFPQQRPFILMRAGYSGSQRFGLIPWSGDVNRSWAGLQSQTEIALQMGMQGLAYMHSDLGGFANPNLDDELYTRWLQYGVFQPIFRPHAQEEVPSEPVYRAPAAMALAREAIKLRYRLLPYIYTAAFDNSRSGLPLMRPMLYEEPGNARVRDETGAYLWGDAFLVAPVVEQGQKEKAVYFPATAAWFDFHSGQRHEGGTTAAVPLFPDRIPVYVRAGAFVPMAPEMQNTREYSSARLKLHYFHDSSVKAAEGKLYDDDGATPDAYENGKYEIVRFAGSVKGNVLALSVRSETGSAWRAPERRIAVVVHNVAARPKAVLVDGRRVAFAWKRAGGELAFSMVQVQKVEARAAITL